MVVIVDSGPVESVVASISNKKISTHTPCDDVISVAADNHIIARTTQDSVVSGTAFNPVIAIIAADGIGSRSSINLVGTGTTLDSIPVLGHSDDATGNLSRQAKSRRCSIIGINRFKNDTIRPTTGRELDHPWGRLGAQSANRNAWIRSIDGQRFDKALDRVGTSGRSVVGDRTGDLSLVFELKGSSGSIVPKRSLFIGFIATEDAIVAIATEDHIIAATSQEEIIAGTAIHPVIATSAVEFVIAAGTNQNVVTIVSIELGDSTAVGSHGIVAITAVKLDRRGNTLGNDKFIGSTASVADDACHTDVVLGEALESNGRHIGGSIGRHLVANGETLSLCVIAVPISATIGGSAARVECQHTARRSLVVHGRCGIGGSLPNNGADFLGARIIGQSRWDNASALQVEGEQGRSENIEGFIEERDLEKAGIEADPQECVQPNRQRTAHIEQALWSLYNAVLDLDETHFAIAPFLARLDGMPRMIWVGPDGRFVVEIEVDGHRDIALSPGLDQAAQAQRSTGDDGGRQCHLGLIHSTNDVVV